MCVYAVSNSLCYCCCFFIIVIIVLIRRFFFCLLWITTTTTISLLSENFIWRLFLKKRSWKKKKLTRAQFIWSKCIHPYILGHYQARDMRKIWLRWSQWNFISFFGANISAQTRPLSSDGERRDGLGLVKDVKNSWEGDEEAEGGSLWRKRKGEAVEKEGERWGGVFVIKMMELRDLWDVYNSHLSFCYK